MESPPIEKVVPKKESSDVPLPLPPAEQPEGDDATRNNLADSIDEEGGSKKRSAKKSFAQRMDELRAYKKRNGHVNVKYSDDKSLYRFCIGIRNARNNDDGAYWRDLKVDQIIAIFDVRI